ncbi:MAG: hypothetical protein DKT66_20150 [Candidatus Melainabacteria bacterium]|nr:MAG: hypothetical protein DKT66_20150 [Candidatus Melainabacteria bacterium]
MIRPLPRIEVIKCEVLEKFERLGPGIFKQGSLHVKIDGKPFIACIVEALSVRGISFEGEEYAAEDDWLRMQVENALMAIYFRNRDPKRYFDYALNGVKTRSRPNA